MHHEEFDTSVLPDRLRRILGVIRDAAVEHGYAPSSREIAGALGMSPSSVSRHLRTLEEAGYLRRGRSVARPVDIRMFLETAGEPRAAADTVGVPLVGTIAAGTPILAEEHSGEVLSLPRDLVGRGTLFSLRVQGDSMIDAAICDGDIVVIRRQPEAWNGEIVAAMLGDEATVKVFQRRATPPTGRSPPTTRSSWARSSPSCAACEAWAGTPGVWGRHSPVVPGRSGVAQASRVATGLGQVVPENGFDLWNLRSLWG